MDDECGESTEEELIDGRRGETGVHKRQRNVNIRHLVLVLPAYLYIQCLY